MHLVGFIIRIFHDAWSPERRIESRLYCTVKLQRCVSECGSSKAIFMVKLKVEKFPVVHPYSTVHY